MDIRRFFRGPFVWIALAVLLVILASSLLGSVGAPKDVDTSQVIAAIEGNEVTKATIVDPEQRIEVTLTDGSKIRSEYVTGQGLQLQEQLQAKVKAGGIKDGYNVEVPRESVLLGLLYALLPVALIILLLFFFMRQMQGGGNRIMNFGKSKAKLVSKDMPKTTFADVAGADEAVEELQEIKEFLQEPAKFQAVGAKIPKGVLLYGPPGTGKTLLARAVAGEAGVPFFSISGSDFVEMFVGVGASRVRDLFEQAKANAPAIVFVDEIDAVGRHRGAGLGGGHDEREQTLNQLLVEMDGFDVKGGVILIAATNRPDILDPALLRPGRFDRQIAVSAPDLAGREQILQVHSRGKPLAPGVDLTAVARRTPGFTGADLANVPQRGRAAHRAHRRHAHRRRCARRGHRPRGRRPAAPHPPHERAREARSPPTTRAVTHWSLRRSRTPTRCTRSRSSRAVAPSVTRWCCPTRTSTPPPATRCSTSSPTCSAAVRPRSSSSTTRPPARPTTSRRRPRSPARW